MKNPPFNKQPRWPEAIFRIGRSTAAVFVAASLTLGLIGCGSGTTGSSGEGNLTVSLTDAPGDFSVYAVDVASISLTKANGTEVETLPLTTMVDFSQYVDMTEFLTAATVPSGRYTSGSMTLDFSGATIQVEDDAGNPVAVTLFVDTNGDPISSLEVAIKLDDKDALTIAPGIPSHLSLDFDLKASNSVDFSDPDNPVLTIDPILIAEVNIERDKPHRIRGPLKNVDVDENSYTVILRPFFHRQSNDRRFGELDVITDSETVFDIDGVSYLGADGIRAMAILDNLTATRAIGNFRLNPRRLIATQVSAGSSVEGGSDDVVRGTVTARENNVLTVQGATLIRTDGSYSFNSQVSVLIAGSTQVKKQLSTEEHQIDEISVGQRIAVFGTMTNLSAETLELDASNGTARLLITTIRGHVVEAADPTMPELAVNLQSIDRRRASLFDFSGTGIDASNDADMQYYQIDTATLNFSELLVGSPILARGFTSAFTTAPKDFEVQTLVSFQAKPANLVVMWHPASMDVFETLDETGFTLDLSSSDRFHHISQGGFRIDLTTLESPISTQPAGEDEGAFVISAQGERIVHTSYSAFVEELQRRLNDGALTQKIHIHGEYNAEAGTLLSNRMSVKLQ